MHRALYEDAVVLRARLGVTENEGVLRLHLLLLLLMLLRLLSGSSSSC